MCQAVAIQSQRSIHPQKHLRLFQRYSCKPKNLRRPLLPSSDRSHTSSLMQDPPGASWQQSRESCTSRGHSQPRRLIHSEKLSPFWASHKLERDLQASSSEKILRRVIVKRIFWTLLLRFHRSMPCLPRPTSPTLWILPLVSWSLCK